MTNHNKLPLVSVDDDSIKSCKPREIWPDILRIIATFGVIVIHSSAPGCFGRFNPGSTLFQACSFYNSLFRFAVPVFVMISGMFLLDENREYSIKKLWFTKICRLAVAYLLCAIFYALVYQYFHLPDLIYKIVHAHYHLWFLCMLSGLYAATPILRWISQNEKVTIYFMTLAFVTVFCCNALEKIPMGGSSLAYTINQLDLKLVAGYSTYFLLGNYIAKHKINQRNIRIGIYVMGVLAVCGTIIFNGAYSVYRGIAREWVIGDLWPNTFMAAVAIFVFCQSYFSEVKFSQRQSAFIFLLSKSTFGIYLVHAFFLEHLWLIGLPKYFIHPLFSIPITSCLTFVLSFCVVYVMNKIFRGLMHK